MQICTQWFAIRILSVSVGLSKMISISIRIRKNSRISANIYPRTSDGALSRKVLRYLQCKCLKMKLMPILSGFAKISTFSVLFVYITVRSWKPQGGIRQLVNFNLSDGRDPFVETETGFRFVYWKCLFCLSKPKTDSRNWWNGSHHGLTWKNCEF